MGNIGDVSRNPSVSDTISDMTGLRCPIGECKVFEVSDVRGFTAGQPQVRSDIILLPLQTVTSGIIVAAYEAPRTLVKCIPDSTMHTGQRLCFSIGVDGYNSNLFIPQGSNTRCTAITLEAKIDSKSDVLVHFNGVGFETGSNVQNLYIT